MYHKMKNKKSNKITILRFFILLILFCQSKVSLAQLPKFDTIGITLEKAEQLFLKNNLQLLSQKYNVDATKALIIQAKLYPNPNFNFAQGAYNPQTGKWFEIGANAEEAYQVSQLIVLSHKIKKQVKIAETNSKLAEDNLYDMLRSLKLALRVTFYNIYYYQQTAKVYTDEINSLTTIVAAYKQIEDKGYIAESDIVRVQAQLYSLQSEYQNLIDNINDNESQLRLLMQTEPTIFYKPEINSEIINADPLRYGLKTLMDSTYNNRTDLMIAKDNLLLSQQTYTYQKALAVPDITTGINADRHGSYYTDFNSLNIGIDIPIFNRNQGNIKNAKILINYNETQLQLTKKTVEEEVIRGLQKALDADKLYRGIDTTFTNKFDHLAKEMMKNYMKRNVSLINFLTFYDSYKQNIVQFNTILLNKIDALENINYLTGTNFFNK